MDTKKTIIRNTCDFCKQILKSCIQLECEHMTCLGCLIEIKKNSLKCLKIECTDKKKLYPNIEFLKDKVQEENIHEKKTCEICCEEFDKLVLLKCCSKEMCSSCIESTFKTKPQCPFCLKLYNIPKGIQPDGTMFHRIIPQSLAGYEKYRTIQIEYSFPDGIQGKNHPSPGKRYIGTTRIAYLPANAEGFKALDLLYRAFQNRLTFTIGISRTSGTEGLTWNDIHHKTSLFGPFGYPDSTYLNRLFDELKAHGIE